MLPLTLVQEGEESIIRRISGTDEVKNRLEALGFVVGGTVIVVSRNGGNLIVNVKESRIAVDEKLAQKIMV